MAEWEHRAAQNGTPGYAIYKGDIKKPDLDDRHYRLIHLENGIRAMLVHDPSTDKAAACLTVHVGAMHDPSDIQGLAHFCEHLIIKGSKPFPEERDFLSYVSSNGGLTNAVTGPSYAYYWFSIGTHALAGALARQAAFFHSPLFAESLAKREINAVDSEHRRNKQNDPRRILHVNKALYRSDHPYSQFSTGTIESITSAARKLQEEGCLSPIRDDNGEDSAVFSEIRRRLVEWWEQQYCAGRMVLAVLGNEPLDELSEMVVPHYSQIANRGLEPRPIFTQPLWNASKVEPVIFIKTVKDYYGLCVTFLLPDQRQYRRCNPGKFITHFMGHEGPGSVCAYLKKEGWLVSLNSSVPSTRNPSVQYFQVTCTLTKEGYAHYKEVLIAIYDYLALLRSSQFESYHFTEIKAISELEFRFQDKTQPHTYVNWLSRELLEDYPPESVLADPVLVHDWDEEIVRRTLALLVPEKGRVTLEAREHPDEIVGRDMVWATEQWFGTEYCFREPDATFMEKARRGPHSNVQLYLPNPNPFIPKNLKVKKAEVNEIAKAPRLLRHTVLSTLWHKKDDQFWVPRADVRIDIKSSVAYGTPRQAVLTRLFADLVEDALSELTYDAYLAGLAFSISDHRKGLSISLSGYNDKLPILLKTVMARLVRLEVDPGRLSVIADQAKREYDNFYLAQPSNLSETFAAWTLTPIIWSPSNKSSEISSITAEDIKNHKRALLSRVYLETLVNGNVNEQDAVSLLDTVEQCLSARPILPSERSQSRALVIPSGANIIVRKHHQDHKEGNCSISYYCQFGDAGDARLCAVLELIAHIIKEPVRTQLRTREQLGYVVSASSWTAATSVGLGIKIQTTRPPWDAEQRIDAFLESFYGVLESLAQPDFDDKKKGLIVKTLEKDKNLSEETRRFWNEIDSGYYAFKRKESEAEMIGALNLQDVLHAYNHYIRPSTGSATRKKLSVHLISQQMQEAPRDLGAMVVTDDKEPMFKASLGCYPAAVPVIPGLRTMPSS
ncbi:LuxS/MPP-like metallohydrolase [Wolfiporia cocos MD-104 SS10]|uniref:LuxS/MPP-like metallohydrolase n=1 Tax=Wolfiporia cocos (strain MD-104) TaxID=742152 RepID=A0A2H3JWL9_WOLCO|nr:LuxS/MPP-like metallohydrolase [Wolfiporia cocos MD-104 SS10]